jgi:Uma2 family endonuclease
MAAPHQLTDAEWLLLTTPDDTEEAPWMVNPGFQSRIVALLLNILRRYNRRLEQPWYMEAELKVVMPRRITPRSLDLAPDLLLAQADDHPRDSWVMAMEGRPPFLVAEVVTSQSTSRDLREKPVLYDQMGVREYLIFAPRRKRGQKLTGFRRLESGLWAPWPLDQEGQLRSEALGGLLFYLDVQGEEHWLRVRDQAGRLLPSDGEAALAAEARADSEAARADSEAAARSAADARAEAAMAELAQLRAQLEEPTP